MKLININNVFKNYHTLKKEINVLDNISFDINTGEVLSILGTSGCGKSTMLNIIAKLEKPSSGFIKENVPLTIGYMMQNDNLLPWLNVYENACLGLKLKHIYNKNNIEYLNYLLKKYNLYDFRYEYPNQLSGGMRQRLQLIRTLAIKPNILLLDEPFSKLDIDSRIMISDDVYNIVKELNITTILITHDVSEALTLSDRIIIFSKRPAKIKKIINLDYKKEKPSNIRNEVVFNKLYNLIWSMLDHE